MTDGWRAWLAQEKGAPATLVNRTDEALRVDGVTVDVEYSSVNFKDGLALMGRPGVVRSFPLVAGIDLVGTVVDSPTEEWSPGDRVLVNGCGLGETDDGGLTERARVDASWLVRVPDGLSSARAAAIGTAGFTAMLAVLAIEEHAASTGSAPQGGRPILVTGASGGVGSIAVALLASLGFEVTASTGSESSHDYLRALGASDIVDRHQFDEVGKPLQSERWSAAIDSVGGPTLANVLAQTEYGGVVASCGLASSSDLPATVMPFILRAVTLAGINSVYCPRARRQEAWDRLAMDLDLGLLDSITETVALADAQGVAERILSGSVRGRTVVDVKN
jgi:acrylyl-CoA reductase (NADPH)